MMNRLVFASSSYNNAHSSKNIKCVYFFKSLVFLMIHSSLNTYDNLMTLVISSILKGF
jgi:hypothetical protein